MTAAPTQTAMIRIRLLVAAGLIAVITACGSGDGSGTRPSISATLPPRATQPAGTDAAAPPPAETTRPPVETAAPPSETQPAEQPAPQPTEPAEQPAPETAAPDAAPSDTTASTDDGDSTLWWPWVLAAIVLIGAIVLIARRRRTSPAWQTQANALLDEIDQVTSHLVTITPDGLRAVAQADATRLASARAALRRTIETAGNSADQAMFNELTAPLAALHTAVDSAGLSAQPNVAAISQLATQLHTSSASVRAGLALRH